MSCIIKQRTERSPGIVILTQAEALFGIARTSKRVREYLHRTTDAKEWIFGVHLQGDPTRMSTWPLEKWQRFIMWPNPASAFAAQLPKENLMEFTCASFIPAMPS